MSVKRKTQNEIDTTRLQVQKKKCLDQKEESRRKEIDEIRQEIRNEEREKMNFALRNQRRRNNHEKMMEFNEILLQLQSSNKPTDNAPPSTTNKLTAIPFKNRMSLLCKRFSWRSKEFNLCAMTPIEEEEDEENNWLEERRNLLTEITVLKSKLFALEQNHNELQVELQEARDQNELLEFRILEVEQSCHNEQMERQNQPEKYTSLNLNENQEEKWKEILTISPWKDLSLHVKQDLIQLLLRFESNITTNKNDLMDLPRAQIINTSENDVLDNKFDVISQSGETGYSSDDEGDVNSDTTSPIPSFDEPKFGSGVSKEFFWSLSEVARRIKESEATKLELRVKSEKLESELKREVERKDEIAEELGKVKQKMEDLEKKLVESEREMRNKEVEFALKIDAIKCERDEVVSSLENRIAGNNKIENELREELERIIESRNKMEMQVKIKQEESEIEKEFYVNQLNALREKNQQEEIFEDDLKETRTNSVQVENVGELTGSDLEENKHLKQRIFELETKENAYRQTLHQADKLMADLERNYQERIDEQERVEEQLRARIVQLEQCEKRLRQSLKNNKNNWQMSKFAELMDRLMESEACEQQLKNRIHQLDIREKESKEMLGKMEDEKRRLEQEIQDQDELLSVVSNLQREEKELRQRIGELETSEEALKETLSQADLILMEREKDLRQKIRSLESELNGRAGVENRNVVVSDVIENNCRLQCEMDELKEINETLRSEVFSLKSELMTATSKADHSQDTERTRENTYLKLNLDILEKDSQIEKLVDKIRLFEAGNIPMEFHALSLYANELEQLKEKVDSFSDYISKCNCCNCMNCKLLLNDVEKQVTLLNQLVSGNENNVSESEEMKEEKNLKSGISCQIEELLSNCAPQNQVPSQDEICTQLENELKEKSKIIEKYEQQTKLLENKLANQYEEFTKKIEHLMKIDNDKEKEIEKLRRCVWKAEVTEKVLREKYFKKSQQVTCVNKQIRELEQKVSNYARQLRNYETHQKEIENLRDRNQHLEVELKNGKDIERKLHAENLHLHHKVESQKERIKSIQVMKKNLTNKIEHLEKNKRDVTSAKTQTSAKEKKRKDINNHNESSESRQSDFDSTCCSTSSENITTKSKSKIPRYISSPREIKELKNTNKNINDSPIEPENFRITRRVGQDSLIVAWNLPQVDGTISGYLISVNGELHQKVRSVNRTKALLNQLDLSGIIKIDIESINEKGNKSNKVSCTWTNDQTPSPTVSEYKKKRILSPLCTDGNVSPCSQVVKSRGKTNQNA